MQVPVIRAACVGYGPILTATLVTNELELILSQLIGKAHLFEHPRCVPCSWPEHHNKHVTPSDGFTGPPLPLQLRSFLLQRVIGYLEW